MITTNPVWTDLEKNPGLRGERQETNRLSYGTAIERKWFNSTRVEVQMLLTQVTRHFM
jgi:hypothetical protein